MSGIATASVWQCSQHKGSHLTLMLAIADDADDDGVAHMSRNEIARKIRLSPEYTRLIIRDVCTSQPVELSVTASTGGKPANKSRYRILLPMQVKETGEARLPRQNPKGGRPASGGPPPGEARLPRPASPTLINLTNEQTNVSPAVRILLESGERKVTDRQAEQLAEALAKLGEYEYRRLIDWGAERASTTAAIIKAARVWKPEWTPEEKEQRHHATRNTPGRPAPHKPGGRSHTPQANRPTPERAAADRALAEERRRRQQERGVAGRG